MRYSYNSLLSFFHSIIVQVAAYWRIILNKRTFSSLTKGGCSQDVPNVKRIDLETFGILENWTLRSGSCNWRFDCNEPSALAALGGGGGATRNNCRIPCHIEPFTEKCWLRGTRYAVSEICKTGSCLSCCLRGTR